MSKTTHKLSSRRPPITHNDFRAFQREVRRELRTSREAIGRMGTRIRQVEVTLDPLVDHVGALEHEVHDLEERVTRLERRRTR